VQVRIEVTSDTNCQGRRTGPAVVVSPLRFTQNGASRGGGVLVQKKADLSTSLVSLSRDGSGRDDER
jgi:hypothetical protein